MLRVGSTFAGIGGIDLGLERAGMQTVWQAEKDPKASVVLARHWPNVKRFDDVRDVTRDSAADIDVLCGGFPCQDLSVAGRRKGLAGERSGLFFEFARIAAELTPTWLLIENVPGLLSSNGGRDMGTVLTTLAELGYGWAYRILNAQYFRVAQRRRRVFIVGCLRTDAPPRYFLCQRAAAGILRRAENRERTLPPLLQEALERVAQTTTKRKLAT